MKVGMIFECGPDGADKKVCAYFAAKLLQDAEIVARTLDNKPRLLTDAGQVAAQLLADGCDKVLIIWDLRPAWPSHKQRPCRHEERAVLHQALLRAGVREAAPVHLVCIEQELESWLLADEGKLSNYLSRATHRYKVKKVQRPDEIIQPKAVMNGHFGQSGRGRYNDLFHAEKIIREGEPDWRKLRRSPSFQRFEAKLTE